MSPESLGKYSTSYNRRSVDLSKPIKSVGNCDVCGGPLRAGARRYCSPDCYRVVQRSGSVEDRFWSKVVKGEGCWLWGGQVNRGTGYGVFTWAVRFGRGRPVGAHRVAYELAHGPIPERQWVLHSCDTPLCVRPDHLFLGTQTQNMADAATKGRLSVGRPKRRKITTEQLHEIDARLAKGDSQKEIARDYGMSKGWVSLYANGRRRRFDRPRFA